MKFQIASDLHLDFNALLKNKIPVIEPYADLLIMPGDLCECKNLFESLKKFCDLFKEVIYVPGNHDYYDSSFQEVEDELSQAESVFKNLYVLENRIVEIENKRILGTTLWFENDPNNILYSRYLSDFDLINGFVPTVYDKNAKAKAFLEKFMKKGDIVVTHHMPHHKSIAPEYKGDQLNRFFYCNMEELISEREPSIWIHGHTHHSFDYKANKTRIVCNPFGYRGMGEGRQFKDNLAIEL